jgi:hypothetical protein
MTGRVPHTTAEAIREHLRDALAAHRDGCENQARAAVGRILEIECRETRAKLDTLCARAPDTFGLLNAHEGELLALMKKVYGPGGAP